MKSFDEEIYEEIIRQAKEAGYTIYAVSTPSAKTLGQVRIGGSKVTNAPDAWMNSVNVTLWKIQNKTKQ